MISRMKRFLSLFAILFLLLQIPAGRVRASAENGQYAVADARDVWFYGQADESKGLFLLPYTYYVRVISEGEIFSFVEYQDSSDGYKPITGYCLREQLTYVDFVPARPYLKKRITLTYTIDTGAGVGNGSFNNMERTVCFYGAFSSGTAPYYYVYADGVFDYVPAVEPVTYDLNTDYVKPATGETDPPPAAENKGVNGMQIALICVLCGAAAVVAFFVIRGKKPPAPNREED